MRLKPLCLAFALGLYSAGMAHAGFLTDESSMVGTRSADARRCVAYLAGSGLTAASPVCCLAVAGRPA